MSTKDKTEDQLLSSIRKNKPAAATPRKTAAKKAAPRKAAAKPAAAAPEPAPAVRYQAGRRVWPD